MGDDSPKRRFRPGRQARDTAAYPEVLSGRRAFLRQLGLLGGSAASALILIRCGDVEGKPLMMDLRIQPREATIDLRQTIQLKAIDSTGGLDVTASAAWRSDDVNVVSVDARGVATGVGSGQTAVWAQHNDEVAAASLTVQHFRSVTTFELTAISLKLPVGGTVDLDAWALFEDGTSEQVNARASWSSGNTWIATVSEAAGQEGRVTAVAPGKATITAFFVNGPERMTARADILVTP